MIATTAAGSRQQSRFLALVDNYDRLKELIDIASDSTGKADEQFAKYAETMEYKLNQLATKWEEFRTSFIDQEDFKKAIDLATQLLDKAMNLDPTRAAMIIPFAVLFAKTFVEEIFRQFQASKNNFAQLGAMAASGAIGTGMSKLSPGTVNNYLTKKINQPFSKQAEYFQSEAAYALINQQQAKIEIGRLSTAIVSGYKEAASIQKSLQQVSKDFTVLTKGQKALSNQDVQTLMASISKTGFFDKAALENVYKDLKLSTTTSSRKIDDKFIKTFEDKVLTPMQNQYNETKTLINTQRNDRQNLLTGIESSEAYYLKNSKKADFWGRFQLRELTENEQWILNQGAVQGTVQGMQQIGSAAGMMASMLIAGAKATDTLNVGLTMLVMSGISQSINAISSLIPFIQAKNIATQAEQALSKKQILLSNAEIAAREKNRLLEKAIIDGKTAEIEAEQVYIAEKNVETLTEEVNTLETEKNTTAKNANAAATTLATAAIAAGIIILAAATIALAKYLIKQAEEKRALEDSATAAGMAANAQNNLEKNLNKVANELSKYKEKAEDAKGELDKLTDATDKYIQKVDQAYAKNNLTEEETENWIALQNEIAEIHPELINYYDEQGNAILDLSANWDQALKSAREYYAFNAKEEGLQALKGTALEYGTATLQEEALKQTQKKQENIFNTIKGLQKLENKASGIGARLEAGFNGFKVDEAGNLIWIDADDKEINLSEKTKTSNLNVGAALLDLKTLEAEDRNNLFEILKIALQKSNQPIDISDLDSIASYDALADKINEKLKDTNWATNVWPKVLESINDENINNWLKEAQRSKQESEQKIQKTYKSILKNLAYSDEEFAIADQNIQDLMLAHYQDRFSLEDFNKYYEKIGGIIGDTNYAEEMRLYLEDQFFEGEEFKNPISYSTDEINAYNEALSETNNNYERYKYLVETLGEEDNLVEDYYKKEKQYFEDRQKNAKILIQGVLGYTDTEMAAASGAIIDKLGDIIDTKNSPILAYYETLGVEAQARFIEGYTKYSADSSGVGRENANAYFKAYVDTLSKSNLNQAAQDFISSYDFGIKVSEATKANNRASFIREVLGYDKTASEKEIGEIFDSLLNSAEKANIYIKSEFTDTVFETTKTQIDSVNEALETGESILQSLSQRSGSIINIDPKERKNIEKLIYQLSQIKDAPLDASLFEGLFNVVNGQETFQREKFLTILKEQTVDLGEEILNNNNLEEDQKTELIQLINYTRLLTGEWKTVGASIDNASSAISAFSSAAKEQIDQGYLKASTIKSLGDAFKAMGLEGVFNENKGFLNDKLQLDKNAVYKEISEWMNETEKSDAFRNMTEEQRKMWAALKKELYITNLELQNEAENTDEVADAWKDYNKQLDTVKEKQEALNDKIEAYNKLLYGDDLRKSGLDLLYNYNEAISTFNDEMSRAQDILSDAKNMEDATAAFEQYAAATHRLIVEEKAKQEELQRGLNEYARMIEHGYASYTDTQTGRTIGINFGDYAKFDQNTGKYIINQTLLNRARFNDDYKDLIEEYVETYNKYADEYKKSQDEVLKTEKEFQKLRKEALKNYADFEKSIADELKNQYEEEVDNLKEKYDAMKEEDDDYIKALQEAIEKQRKLRDRESKFEDLAKKEKKLSLISRDTSGANRLQELQLEEEIQKSRQDLLDEQVDNIIDGMQKLYESQEETRNVEIELKEAIIDNTAMINSQAEELGRGFTDADSYIEFMTQSKEFTELTYVQQLEKIEEYRETYAAAAQYMAMQNMDAASKSGDFVKDIIETTGEEIAWVVSNTSSTFVDEASRAYQAVSREVSESLDNAVKDIQNARDALKEAIEKLDEYARKAKELEEKRNYQADLNLSSSNPGADYIPSPVSLPGDAQAAEDAIQQYHDEKLQPIRDAFNLVSGTSKEQILNYVEKYYNDEKRGDQTKQQVRQALINVMGHNVNEVANLSWQGRLNLFKDDIKKYKSGGLVDFTGPAWVDGTKSAPEAFLNPEDTRRIGEAARILSNLPFFNSYGEANETITNNNGNVSIEINLNVDKLSSEIDVNEMLNRVKEEIVSVARPAGINTILTQQ